MYEWNKFQTDEIRSCLGDVTASLWTLPIIHGSFQQVQLDLSHYHLLLLVIIHLT